MKHKSEFDSLVSNYKLIRDRNVRISGETSEYFDKYKCRHFLGLFGQEVLSGKPYILDYGCGVGNILSELASSCYKGSFFGLDPSLESLKIALKKAPGVRFIHFNGSTPPLKEGVFDFIVIVNVLHHTPLRERQKVLSAAARLLKKKGRLVIYEHNPLNPFTVMTFRNNAIDKGASMLGFFKLKRLVLSSGLEIREKGFIVFFPRVLRIFRIFEQYLSFFPLGAQYFVVGEKV